MESGTRRVQALFALSTVSSKHESCVTPGPFGGPDPVNQGAGYRHKLHASLLQPAFVMSPRRFVFASLLMFSAAALAQALPEGVKRIDSVEGITEYRLANGLQVLLVADDSKPTTTVNVTYRVGSRHENYGETGMAHLLEHLLFKGTPTNSNVWAEFTKRGLRANGTTWYDRTNYFASFSENEANLRWYLGWQADAMVNSFIARKDLDSEMTVVRNEFEMGENNPTRVLLQKLLAGMYQWHNYGKSTIGARSDIENVDIPRLQAFYRQYYQPDNATLTVSGRFDATKVLAWVAQDFGRIPKPTRVLPPTYTLDPPQDGERQVTVRRVGGTPLIVMGYHVPAGSDPDFAAVRLLSLVLGDVPGGRLHKRLVEKQIGAQAFAFNFALAEPAPLILGLGLAPGQDVEAARTAMAAVADSLQTEPVTAEELERARTSWLNAWDQGFTDPERVGVAMSEAIAQGDWRLYFLQRDQVRKITLADVQRVASQWLRRDNRTVALYQPTAAPERAPQAHKVDVAALVAGYKGDAGASVAEAFDATPANLDKRTQLSSAGGLKLALLPKGTRGQVVQARLRLRFGTEQSLKGQETVASVVASLLDKGGAGLSRQQIADQFDRLQADVGFSSSGQTVTVTINTKRERLPAVIELVGKLLREPAFDAAPLEELRRQTLASLERQRKEPDAVISNLVARHGNPYPRGDLRYVPSFDESEQDVKAVDLAALRDFHRRFYSAALGEFSAVGDMDVAAVKKALETSFGNWRQPAGGAQAYVRLPQPLVAVAPQRFYERTPDKANANLVGRLALPLNDRHSDYPALEVANYIFGRGGASRLWKRIRETEGLSYDVRSVIDWASIELNSSWNLSAIFAPQNQPKVEKAVQEELARSLKDGFTQQELDEARSGLLNARRLLRAQDAAVAGGLANNLFLDRRFAFAQQIDDALAALTLAQVNAAWRKYIAPERLVIAWGGDFKPQ
jgi:zinc protease